MVAGTEFSPPISNVGSDYSDDSSEVSEVKDVLISDNNEELKQTLNGKPPWHVSVVRHSLITGAFLSPSELDSCLGETGFNSPSDLVSSYKPIFRSGSCAEKGPKPYMEDEHISIDDLPQHLSDVPGFSSCATFYGVFDGHGVTDASSFVRNNILKFIVDSSCFPSCLDKAIKSAFLKADYAFADDSSLDISSGTTALTAFISGRKMIVANAGDCRAVLGKRGRAVEMSNDHKPNYVSERQRIEKLGGAIYDGYLNGQLSVSRALGDWHMKRPERLLMPSKLGAGAARNMADR